MLSSKERWLLTGAWALLAACTAGGLWLAGSKAEPIEISAFRPSGGPGYGPPSNRTMDRFWKNQEVMTSVRRPESPYVGCMVPTIVEIVKPPPPPGPTRIPPVALYSGMFE